jgi:hypothetical protein
VEDGAVHLLVEAAQLEDARVGAGRVLEAVVGDGQADVVVDHVGGAEVVQPLADVLEGGDDGAGIGLGEGKGLEAVGGGVAHVSAHRG